VTLALSPEVEPTAADVHEALSTGDCAVLVTQLDLPPEVVAAVVSARRPGQTLIGNLVPHPGIELRMLDGLVVNVHEAATILGVASIEPAAAARELRALGPWMAVVTAGADGVAYHTDAVSGVESAEAVPVVDTTGAGDAFLGALALRLSRRAHVPEAVAEAVRVASIAVRHRGAQLPAGHERR